MYECGDCNSKFEIEYSLTDTDGCVPTICPFCGSGMSYDEDDPIELDDEYDWE